MFLGARKTEFVQEKNQTKNYENIYRQKLSDRLNNTSNTQVIYNNDDPS